MLREGAHHVVHDLQRRGGSQLRDVLGPLLAALDDMEPSVAVPLAAERAIDALGSHHGGVADPGGPE